MSTEQIDFILQQEVNGASVFRMPLLLKAVKRCASCEKDLYYL
jgi:hypothetical protein